MTPSTWAAVLMLSLLSVVTTAAGVALALWSRRQPRYVAAGMGFSAGMMIVVSLVELLPEAITEAGFAAAAVAATAGAVGLWSAHWLVPHVHLVREAPPADAVATREVYLVVLGLILHDVPEGFAMANAYVASPALGVLVAMAIALHNLPEEYAIAVPAATLRTPRFLFGAAALSALAEPAGAVAGLAAVEVSAGLNPLLLAFAAGAMTFVSLHELLPLARRYGHGGWLAGGAWLSLPVYALLTLATAAMAGGAA